VSTTLVASADHDDRFSGGTQAVRAFRVRRPPALEPPFDDERDAPDARTIAESAALAPLRRVPPGLPSSAQATVMGATPNPAGATSTAGHAASRCVQVCLEVLNGFRPPSHLRRLAGSVEFADVLRHLRLRQNGGLQKGQPARTSRLLDADRSGRPIPAQSSNRAKPVAITPTLGRNAERAWLAHPNRSAEPAAFRLLRLRVTEPLPGRAEAVAVIARADTTFAIAIRLELRKSAWVCTVFQVV
jgi:Family of unknown function (DUF6459)